MAAGVAGLDLGTADRGLSFGEGGGTGVLTATAAGEAVRSALFRVNGVVALVDSLLDSLVEAAGAAVTGVVTDLFDLAEGVVSAAETGSFWLLDGTVAVGAVCDTGSSAMVSKSLRADSPPLNTPCSSGKGCKAATLPNTGGSSSILAECCTACR